METLISVGLESCLHYTCCVALSTFAPHVSKKPLCYNYTSLPVCPQLCHSLSGNNYVTSFPVRQQLYATSCPPRSYMPLPVRQEAICHSLSPPTTISFHPQLYPPTHNYILPSTTVRRCLAHPPLVDKIRYTTTIYVTISAGHRRTKNRYRLVTSHNITSRGPPPGSKKIRYM